MARVAALDLGSNTLRLLVADVEHGQWTAVQRGLATPRLGRAMSQGDQPTRLDPTATQQAMADGMRFCQLARDLGARRVVLAATQACRRAVDGEAFVSELADQLDLDRARIISGEEEARLSRVGVLSRLSGDVQGALLADVGGGSTELSPLDDESGAGLLSLKLGAVSLTEEYLTGDPPTARELRAMERAVARGLEEIEPRAKRLVATAGSAATLASLVLRLGAYQPDEINNLEIGAEQLQDQALRLAAMDLDQRKQVHGLEAERADIILAGLAILRGLLKHLGLQNLTTMDAGLLEGIMLDDLATTQYLG